MSRTGLGLSAAERRRRHVDATRIRKVRHETDQYLAFCNEIRQVLSRTGTCDGAGFLASMKKFYQTKVSADYSERMAQKMEDDGFIQVTWTDAGAIKEIRRA